MGSAKKKNRKNTIFFPILDAETNILLIFNSKHPTQKLGFRESLESARHSAPANALTKTNVGTDQPPFGVGRWRTGRQVHSDAADATAVRLCYTGTHITGSPFGMNATAGCAIFTDTGAVSQCTIMEQPAHVVRPVEWRRPWSVIIPLDEVWPLLWVCPCPSVCVLSCHGPDLPLCLRRPVVHGPLLCRPTMSVPLTCLRCSANPQCPYVCTHVAHVPCPILHVSRGALGRGHAV